MILLRFSILAWLVGFMGVTMALPADSIASLRAKLATAPSGPKDITLAKPDNSTIEGASSTANSSSEPLTTLDLDEVQPTSSLNASSTPSQIPKASPKPSTSPEASEKFQYAKNVSFSRKVGQRAGHVVLGVKNAAVGTFDSLVQIVKDPAGFVQNVTTVIAHPWIAAKSVGARIKQMWRNDPYEAVGQFTFYGATSAPGVYQLSKTKVAQNARLTVSDFFQGKFSRLGSDLKHLRSGLQRDGAKLAATDVKNVVVTGVGETAESIVRHPPHVGPGKVPASVVPGSSAALAAEHATEGVAKAVPLSSEIAVESTANTMQRTGSIQSHPVTLDRLSSGSVGSAKDIPASAAGVAVEAKAEQVITDASKVPAPPPAVAGTAVVAETEQAANIPNPVSSTPGTAAEADAITAPEVATAAVIGAELKAAHVLEAVNAPATAVTVGTGVTQDHSSHTAEQVQSQFGDEVGDSRS